MTLVESLYTYLGKPLDDNLRHVTRWGVSRPSPVAKSREASEWPRSVCNAGAPSPRRTQGTATGERGERCRWQIKRAKRVAAVDKIEDQRKPEDFIGYRNRRFVCIILYYFIVTRWRFVCISAQGQKYRIASV